MNVPDSVRIDTADYVTTNADFRPSVARFIAPYLQMTEAQLAPPFAKVWRTNEQGRLLTNHYAVLKRKVSVEDWENINHALDLQFTNSVRDALLKFNMVHAGKKNFKREKTFEHRVDTAKENLDKLLKPMLKDLAEKLAVEDYTYPRLGN